MFEIQWQSTLEIIINSKIKHKQNAITPRTWLSNVEQDSSVSTTPEFHSLPILLPDRGSTVFVDQESSQFLFIYKGAKKSGRETC